MAKVTKSPEQPQVGRIPSQKYGGRAKSPFLHDWRFPKPARGFSITKGRRKK